MNILFLHRVWPSFGGGETVTKCLAKEFIRRGHSIHVLYFKKYINPGDSITVDDKVVETLIPEVSFDENSNEFGVDKQEANRVSRFTIDYVNANKIDIVINQWWPVEYHKDLHEATGAKVIKCLHMDPDTRKVLTDIKGIKGSVIRLLEPLYRFVERKKHLYSCDKYLKHSDLLVFLAPSYKNFYDSHTSIKDAKKKTDYAYNPAVYDHHADENRITDKNNEVIVVGRLLEKHKQVLRVLRTWESLDNDILSNWALKIVGDGPDRRMYENYSREKNLINISFEGFQNPMPYYEKASIMLMTSAYEGWPMAIVEAHQNGVAVLAMDTFLSAKDIIQDGVNGLLSSSSVDEFKVRLLSLMHDKDLRVRVCKNALTSVKQYSADRVVDRWLDIFKKL